MAASIEVSIPVFKEHSVHLSCYQDYSVLDLIGKGGFACVYRGKCKQTGLEIAIKMVNQVERKSSMHIKVIYLCRSIKS